MVPIRISPFFKFSMESQLNSSSKIPSEIAYMLYFPFTGFTLYSPFSVPSQIISSEPISIEKITLLIGSNLFRISPIVSNLLFKTNKPFAAVEIKNLFLKYLMPVTLTLGITSKLNHSLFSGEYFNNPLSVPTK